MPMRNSLGTLLVGSCTLVPMLVACGDDIPRAGNGVIWDCFGLLFDGAQPAAEIGPAGEPHTVCADPDVPKGDVQQFCQETCEEKYSGSFPWNFLGEFVDTFDCSIADTAPTSIPCGGALQQGQIVFMNGGPSQSRADMNVALGVSVSGESGSTFGPGQLSHTIGPCAGDLCTLTISRINMESSGAFSVGGQTVNFARVQNVDDVVGQFTPSSSTFTIPPGAFLGQVSFFVNGEDGSLILPNPQAVTGTISSGTVSILGGLSDGDRSVSFDATGAVTESPPEVTLSPGDTTLQCSGNRSASITFTSSASDVDGNLLTTKWSVDGVPVTEGVSQLPLTLAVGSHEVAVVAFDQRGAADFATAHVEVVDTLPPQFTFVPPAVTISSCANAAIGLATAADQCGAVSVTNNAPAVFPLGTTIVTWTARDLSGNQVTATQTVTAVLGDDPSCCPAGTTIRLGTPNNDVITGTSGRDCILGRGGQDQLRGAGGSDLISGGEGDDVVEGGDGDDVLVGGGGQDRLVGGLGVNSLSGSGGDDTLLGGDGNDQLRGGDGQDRLFGEVGNDGLFGENGDDRLEGGPGNDAMDGGGLHDTCISGGGTDTFTSCETSG